MAKKQLCLVNLSEIMVADEPVQKNFCSLKKYKDSADVVALPFSPHSLSFTQLGRLVKKGRNHLNNFPSFTWDWNWTRCLVSGLFGKSGKFKHIHTQASRGEI